MDSAGGAAGAVFLRTHYYLSMLITLSMYLLFAFRCKFNLNVCISYFIVSVIFCNMLSQSETMKVLNL